MSNCDSSPISSVFSDSRQDNPVYSIKKKSNNLFLCSFSTLNKSYWTFPDQINRGDRKEEQGKQNLDMQKKKKKCFLHTVWMADSRKPLWLAGWL